MMNRHFKQTILGNVLRFTLTAGTIFLAIRLGYLFTSADETAVLVWPPSGIALAALLLCGWRYWPAVTTGMLAGYLSLQEPLSFALAASAGNTLEPLLGYWLLQRFIGPDLQLTRLRDLLGLLICGAICAPLAPATVGAIALSASGMQPWSSFWPGWLTWWLGNMFGVVIFAPLLLHWLGQPLFRITRLKMTEAGFVGMLLIWANLLVFGGYGVPPEYGHSLAFVTVPLLLWAALRLGMHGATLSATLTALVAVVSTAYGSGPFTGQSANTDLAMAWMYIMIASVSTLILGATVAERQVAFRALASGIHAASQTQRNLLPDAAQLAQIERDTGLQVAYRYSASQGMGGDVFGAHLAGPNMACLFVGDISGHGIEASLSAVSLHTFIRTTLPRVTEPAALMRLINQFCLDHLPEEVYATMAYLRYFPALKRLEAMVAGHPPLILFSPTSGFRLIGSNMPPLGMFADAADHVEPVVLDLRWHDRLLMYSDGVIETLDSEGQMFSVQELKEQLWQLATTPTVDVPGYILNAVEAWRNNKNGPLDDITVVAIGVEDNDAANLRLFGDETEDQRIELRSQA